MTYRRSRSVPPVRLAGRAARTRARLQRPSTRRTGHLHARPAARITGRSFHLRRARGCDASTVARGARRPKAELSGPSFAAPTRLRLRDCEALRESGPGSVGHRSWADSIARPRGSQRSSGRRSARSRRLDGKSKSDRLGGWDVDAGRTVMPLGGELNRALGSPRQRVARAVARRRRASTAISIR